MLDNELSTDSVQEKVIELQASIINSQHHMISSMNKKLVAASEFEYVQHCWKTDIGVFIISEKNIVFAIKQCMDVFYGSIKADKELINMMNDKFYAQFKINDLYTHSTTKEHLTNPKIYPDQTFMYIWKMLRHCKKYISMYGDNKSYDTYRATALVYFNNANQVINNVINTSKLIGGEPFWLECLMAYAESLSL